MNHFEQVLDFILTIQIWSLVKVFVGGALLLYVVFAFIVVRQVNLMAETLNVPIALPIKTVAWLHLGLAIFTLLFALIIL